MTPTNVALEDLRQQIDRIDNQIHDLIVARAGLASQIAAAKGRGASIWRPQREAAILRRLLDRHDGPFPPAAIARIWREVIGAMLTLEGAFSVAVCVPDDQPGFWDLARDHFGTIATMTTYPAPGAVVRAVTDGVSTVGVLPWPTDDDSDPWWRYLVGDDAKSPRIVARLPFVGAEIGRSALVVARAAIEPSGEDRSFLAVETSDEMSRTRFLSRLSAAGCDVGFVATYREHRDDAVRLHLVELAGFLDPEDAKLTAIQDAAPDAIRRVVWLGAYAVPHDESDPNAARPPGKTNAAKTNAAKPPAKN